MMTVVGLLANALVNFGHRAFGFSGDGIQRVELGVGLLIAGGLVMAVLGFAGIGRRSLWLACAAPFAVAILWGTFGIDSTRAVRALPEAELSYPGATEVKSWARPGEGMGDGVARATLGRDFVTIDSYSEVEAFFALSLGRAGWEGPVDHGYLEHLGVRRLDWQREGFKFQLQFPSASDASGPFRITIYGPPL